MDDCLKRNSESLDAVGMVERPELLLFLLWNSPALGEEMNNIISFHTPSISGPRTSVHVKKIRSLKNCSGQANLMLTSYRCVL